MKAKDGDKFSPTEFISRAEFATMLAKARKLVQNDHSDFSDVTADEAGAIEAVVKSGFMQPTTATTFAPGAPLGQQDLESALSKAFSSLTPAAVETRKPEEKATSQGAGASLTNQEALPVSRGAAASAIVGAMLGASK